MLTATLTLKPSSVAVREACAWFLPGDDPEAWLRTVAGWPVRMECVVFYLVPAPGESRALGALAVAPASATADDAARGFGGRVQAYGRLAKGFYAPVDAVLFPPVADEELRALLCHEVQVWHPVAGLCGFEESDAVRAADLVFPAEIFDEPWNVARAVDPIHSRLRHVRMLLVISSEELFGGENKDIGSEPLLELPPIKDEPKTGAGAKLAQGVFMAGALGAQGIMALLSLVPRRSGPATWVNRLESWALGKLQESNAGLEKARSRELHRLLEMLERDPSMALRHAIPLADLANRGRAAQSSRLGERSMDFNLRRLGGGGPADRWNVPDDMRSSLATKYRAAAQREAALGNHRRAACIFAELLGDFSAAAEMLKRGRFFAEAAVLYRERLRNEAAEAECLAEGGFYDEAIAIHTRRGRWQEVAGLQEKAGRHEAARTAWRRAVDELLAAGDRLGAARLLETKLEAYEEALAQLASAWPRGKQAAPCLEERFALLGRRHDHAGVADLLKELTATEPPAGLTSILVGQLAGLAERLVHEGNRRSAADAVRVRAASALAGRKLDGADEMAVLRALTRIEPQDRVLKRDVLRYREVRLREEPKKAPRVSISAVVQKIVPGKQTPISLPRVGTWLLIQGNEHGIRGVARTGSKRLMLTLGDWTGSMKSIDWADPMPDAEGAPLLTRIDYGGRLVLRRPFAAALEPKMLGPSAAFENGVARVGSPSWWTEDIVAASLARSVLWALRVVQDRLVLASFASETLAHSRDITDELKAAGAEGGGGNLCLEAQGGDGLIALGLGRHLVVMDGDKPLVSYDLGERIRNIIPAPASRVGWSVLLERGAMFFDASSRQMTELDGQMEMPHGALLGDGRLVLIGRTEGRVVGFFREAVASVAWFEFKGENVFAVTCTKHPREFAIFDAQGQGQRWQLPC